jgi:hypothetical protein
LLENKKGDTSVFFHLQEKGENRCIIRSRSCSVKLDFKMLSQISSALGPENVRLIPSGVKE